MVLGKVLLMLDLVDKYDKGIYFPITLLYLVFPSAPHILQPKVSSASHRVPYLLDLLIKKTWVFEI